ncbi:MAG: aldo/keto reductase [Methanobrevibacter sp.]|uniref:aldo/keto reductase n=1 Tax=Methanobrevibacter sp. TaxID=66852 RepID=UPI0026DF9A16|nr:aldo/keto reductase [Methanobrevibacter sp.]MDO5849185.1 aldo/keto reductase [Methanobrevibacter sp.]
MKKLGLGFMRFPLKSDNNKDIDYEKVSEMVDYSMERGFNFFDSGYEYHDGFADVAIRKCLVERYPREDFLISNKLPVYSFTPETDIEAIFNEQLEKCGVEYFDYYMLHCLTAKLYDGLMKELDFFGFISRLKEEGKIKKLGISHHDDANVLNRILTDHPEIEFVLLQINYLDWISPSIQSSKCYKVAKRHGKEILVMEPLKGGNLVNIPADASQMLVRHNPDATIASWGLRFAGGLEGVSTVLSGMSNMEQLKENIECMDELKPLDSSEKKVLRMARKIISDGNPIDCTYCDYCIPKCPENIPISKFFSLYNNAKMAAELQDLHFVYYKNYAREGNPASACTECGECEAICTQHLRVIDGLKDVRDLLEKDDD